MDGGSPPPAPDYRGAAEQTAAGNLQLLNAQTVANRPNQVTPWGTSTWSKTPTFDNSGYTQAMSDWSAKNSQGTWVPGTEATSRWQGSGDSGEMGTTPGVEGHWTNATADGTAAPTRDAFTTNQWTQNMVLSPQEQQALTAQQGIQNRQSQLASTLQGQVSDTMAGGFHAPSLSDYMSGVGKVNQNFGGFTPYGVGATDQSQINVGDYTRGNEAIDQNFRGGPNVWLNGPQFDQGTADHGAQAAYNSATGLLMPQMQHETKALDDQLRLQGLTPGTEAYNVAAQNLQRTQSQSLNQIANQSVLTGNQMANTNYQSALAGYGAHNAAVGQQFGQNLQGFGASNSARMAAQQASLANYQASLQGQNAYNSAQNQAYGQSLAGYGANQSAQQAANAAQQQAYTQGQQGYGTAYTSALSNYLQPLNAMQAVLGGNQVAMPSMPSFATAGNTQGADYTGATNSLGQYNNGVYNANVSSANSTNAAGASAMASIAGLIFM